MMSRSKIARDLCFDPRVRLIIVDIFDTLIFRRAICERRRHDMVAQIAITDPRVAHCRPEAICRARKIAQDIAYRELEISQRRGEVRLEDVIRRQIALLGLPEDCRPIFLAAEVTVEKRVLLPNAALISQIGVWRRSGLRVVGLSDTGLSRSDLLSVIDDVAGRDILDELYTSADLQATKRKGDAFEVVADLEAVMVSEIHHMGDDDIADLRAAASRGIASTLVPRSVVHVALRRADATRFMVARRFRMSRAANRLPPRKAVSDDAPAHPTGPIVAEFCMRLWLYLSGISDRENAVVLFCARGGINMRVAFEHFVTRLGLPMPIRCCDFMVSRLAAIRGPLLAGDDAASEELAREFSDATMSETARALTGADFVFGSEWHQRFHLQTFMRLLRTTTAGAEVRAVLAEQASLFAEHLASLTGGAKRVVLCDTGLYGSTMRLLQAAYPQYEWECLLFARRNYKGFPSPHFARTAGLSVQAGCYNPFNPRTSILRYWQLIESLFEPALPSVAVFRRSGEGTVISNLETPGWRHSIESSCRTDFRSVLQYMSSLDRTGWFEQVTADCDRAWRVLRSAILFPKRSDTQRLFIRVPTRDLGRREVGAGLRTGTGELSLKRRISGIRSAYWREGYIAEAFPRTGCLLQVAMEIVYGVKFVAAGIRRYAPVSMPAMRLLRNTHPRSTATATTDVNSFGEIGAATDRKRGR